jgi:hypothetical protein
MIYGHSVIHRDTTLKSVESADTVHFACPRNLPDLFIALLPYHRGASAHGSLLHTSTA